MIEFYDPIKISDNERVLRNFLCVLYTVYLCFYKHLLIFQLNSIEPFCYFQKKKNL